jgi:translation initiation factor IF-3
MAQNPPFGNRNKYFRKPNKNYIRKNEKIRSREVRVIGPDGTMLGVMNPAEAYQMAKKVGLDLVEVSPTAKPPVCRILDFGKYKYELSKKNKESKSSSSKVKEVKFRVSIEQHDYETKLRRAEKFLCSNFKVKITLSFRGREMEHKDLGFARVKKAVEDLQGVATQDSDAKLVGRNITTILSPVAEGKRVRKFSVEDDEDFEDDSDE